MNHTWILTLQHLSCQAKGRRKTAADATLWREPPCFRPGPVTPLAPPDPLASILEDGLHRFPILRMGTVSIQCLFFLSYIISYPFYLVNLCGELECDPSPSGEHAFEPLYVGALTCYGYYLLYLQGPFTRYATVERAVVKIGCNFDQRPPPTGASSARSISSRAHEMLTRGEP
jgi:hypothetical protein